MTDSADRGDKRQKVVLPGDPERSLWVKTKPPVQL